MRFRLLYVAACQMAINCLAIVIGSPPGCAWIAGLASMLTARRQERGSLQVKSHVDERLNSGEPE